jgi:hyperosmotically inducible periplasmic protein
MNIKKYINEIRQQKGKPTMKSIYSASLMAATFVLLMLSVPAYASSADEGIESSARECYVFKTYLKGDDIKIQSKDGGVTLTGTVAEEPNKTLAQETVASLPGVKSVDNQLKLKDEPGAGRGDALVRARVNLDLLSHRNLSGTKTDVQVKDGIVTLSGEAANQAQIDLTTEYIRDVEGVKDVKNDMTVSEASRTPPEKTMGEKAGDVGDKIGEKAGDVGNKISDTAGDVGKKIGNTASDVGGWIDDASITALVKATLLYHRSTSGLNTKVETIEGVVNLSGKAKNPSEKDLATKFVEDVYGVKSVNNRMTIE